MIRLSLRPPAVLVEVPERLTTLFEALNSALVILNAASLSTSKKWTAAAVTIKQGTGGSRWDGGGPQVPAPPPAHRRLLTATSTSEALLPYGFHTDPNVSQVEWVQAKTRARPCPLCLRRSKPNIIHTYTRRFDQWGVPGSLKWPSSRLLYCPTFLQLGPTDTGDTLINLSGCHM